VPDIEKGEQAVRKLRDEGLDQVEALLIDPFIITGNLSDIVLSLQ